MAEYQAKIDKSLCFDLTQDDKLIGKLFYKSWFKFNALIELANNSNYQVEPKGFWGTTIEIKEKDKENVLLKFKMNWKGEIVIEAYFSGIERSYIFKHRGILKESFVFIDQDGTELLSMKPYMKWKKMNYEYQITTSSEFERLYQKEILLMTSLHCANYYMSMLMVMLAMLMVVVAAT